MLEWVSIDSGNGLRPASLGDQSKLHCCSDGFEIGCDNRERVLIALHCWDRETMSWVATTGVITGEMVRDSMVVAVEARFGDRVMSRNGNDDGTVE